MSDDAISEGLEAWARVTARERATLHDWILIGRACAIGRAKAMQAARVNEPRGSGYSMALRNWLTDHGLTELSASERSWSLDIADNADALTKWWNSLDGAKRRRWAHPGCILGHWRSSVTPPKMRNTAAHNHNGRPGKVRRNVAWTQNPIRRAAHAMAERRSMDFMILAKVACEASIRNTDDISELEIIGHGPVIITTKSLEIA